MIETHPPPLFLNGGFILQSLFVHLPFSCYCFFPNVFPLRFFYCLSQTKIHIDFQFLQLCCVVTPHKTSLFERFWSDHSWAAVFPLLHTLFVMNAFRLHQFQFPWWLYTSRVFILSTIHSIWLTSYLFSCCWIRINLILLTKFEGTWN